jgi:hypothetical protein
MTQLLIENDFLLYGIGGMRAPVPRTSVAPSVGTGTFSHFIVCSSPKYVSRPAFFMPRKRWRIVLCCPSWLFIQDIRNAPACLEAPTLSATSECTMPNFTVTVVVIVALPPVYRYRIVFCKVPIIAIISIQQCDDASAVRSVVSRPYCSCGGRMHNALQHSTR